jgi:RNA dependent RNA polymerase
MPSLPKYEKILQSAFSSNDEIWHYSLPDLPTVDDHAPTEADLFVILKFISFDSNGITLSFNKQKLNRILTIDRPSKFCSVSFAQFRFIENGSKKTADYIENFLISGIKLNGVVYKCFGWSNSQLKSRCCLLYAFPPHKGPMDILNSMGQFENINTVAKKSKRIGLLFSEAELGLKLLEEHYEDIPDVERDGHIFTDGCRLMSLDFATHIARLKKIIFHGNRYTPSVVQIRYRGYKGVLMVNPAREMNKPVYFRKSMGKFMGCPDNTLSILEYSKPYSFGKLNGELVTLLSALGIPEDVFLRKQHEYFDLITKASEDPVKASIFMSYMGEEKAAESIVLNGLQSVKTALRDA